MTNRLSRYLFKECLVPTLLATVVLTLLIILPRVLVLTDMWVNKGAPVSALFEMILYILPKFLVGSLPLALLVGILSVLGRLSQNSEIVVMKASGISLYQIVAPISVLVILFTMVSYALNLFLVPLSVRHYDQLKEALAGETSFNFVPQTFNTDFPGLTLYVNERPQSGSLLKGLLIHDQRNPKQPVTVLADSGLLHTSADERAFLLLTNGSRHFHNSDGAYQKLDFTTYDLDLNVSVAQDQETAGALKTKEMDMAQLAAEAARPPSPDNVKIYIEWHSRLAQPMATLILGILAIPLGIQSHRSGKGYGFVVAILVMVLHFILFSLGEAAAKKGHLIPLVALWAPNLVMTLFTGYVLVQSARERPLAAAVWLANALASLPQRLLRSSAP